MSFEERASNLLLSTVWRVLFRPEYSPKSLRRNFDVSSGASAKSLRKKYPNAVFDVVDLGGVPAECIRTVDKPERTILFLHGGGYFMGSIHAYRRNAMRVAHRCQARVFLPEYRLAPEHPFPAALDDAKQAYLALPDDLPRFIVGDSAGGGLTLATLLALRDEGRTLPAGAVVISPLTDLMATGESIRTHAGRDRCLGKRHFDSWSPWYYAKTDPENPYVSPVYADLAGLPPLLVLVGGEEVLLDDAVRIARRAETAGVDVTLLVEENMQHDWVLSLPWLKRSKKTMDDIRTFLAKLPR